MKRKIVRSLRQSKIYISRTALYTPRKVCKIKFDPNPVIAMFRITFGIILLGIAAFLVGCDPQTSGAGENSPTGAYKRLYAAVKSKKTDDIRAVMSKKSIDFAAMAASRQNKTVEQVLENGFTATTFSPTLPQIRDQRIEGDMGAVEVFNSKENKWEDLPFVLEDGTWKLAIGEMFAGTWKSPGKSQGEQEREAANLANNNLIPLNLNANVNMNSIKPIVPKPATNANMKPARNTK